MELLNSAKTIAFAKALSLLAISIFFWAATYLISDLAYIIQLSSSLNSFLAELTVADLLRTMGLIITTPLCVLAAYYSFII